MRGSTVKFYIIWILKVSIGYTLTTSPHSRIVANNESMLVREGQNAVLNWVISSSSYTNQTVKCTAKKKDIVVAIREYNESHGRFIFTIPQDSQFKFDFRLNGIIHVQPGNKNMFTLTIEKSIKSDIDVYSCSFDHVSADIDLKVYSELVEMGRMVTSVTLTKNVKTVSTELCAYPEPRVTMEFQGLVIHIKGDRKPSSNCYMYYFRNLTSIKQKHCGQELKLVYQGVKKTLRRSVLLIIPLRAEPPDNVHVRLKDKDHCPMIRWDGPNIGSCVSDSIRYDVAVYKNKNVIREMQTSSNVVEVCGIDFLQKDITVKVRNSIGNSNSTWVEGSFVLDEKSYDGMQTAIIACGALAVFLLILMISYCCYVHKYKISKVCAREKRLLVKTASEGEEVEPLNVTQIDGVQPQSEQKQLEPKTESKRKFSRKISLDTLLHDNSHSNTLRKNSSNGGEQNKVNVKPNHATRFNSLQRNIERERKKLEEQELEQRLDDMYAQRRNTDSKVFQDFTSNFNTHHFGPRYSGEGQTNSAGYEQSPGSPLYDVLPTTRSSASTTSTGPSYHEDDDQLPPRSYRNTTDDSSFMSDSSTTPLYDVLPRTNTSVNNTTDSRRYSPHNTQAYDYVPTIKTKDKNGQTPKETIYDVPVRLTSMSNGESRPVPFSSHRKQDEYNQESVYENGT